MHVPDVTTITPEDHAPHDHALHRRERPSGALRSDVSPSRFELRLRRRPDRGHVLARRSQHRLGRRDGRRPLPLAPNDGATWEPKTSPRCAARPHGRGDRDPSERPEYRLRRPVRARERRRRSRVPLPDAGTAARTGSTSARRCTTRRAPSSASTRSRSTRALPTSSSPRRTSASSAVDGRQATTGRRSTRACRTSLVRDLDFVAVDPHAPRRRVGRGTYERHVGDRAAAGRTPLSPRERARRRERAARAARPGGLRDDAAAGVARGIAGREGEPPDRPPGIGIDELVDGVEFDEDIVHEEPAPGATNVFVQVHNRGSFPATGVRSSRCGPTRRTGPPPLPADFWAEFAKPGPIVVPAGAWTLLGDRHSSTRPGPGTTASRSAIRGCTPSPPPGRRTSPRRRRIGILVLVTCADDALAQGELDVATLLAREPKVGYRETPTVAAANDSTPLPPRHDAAPVHRRESRRRRPPPPRRASASPSAAPSSELAGGAEPFVLNVGAPQGITLTTTQNVTVNFNQGAGEIADLGAASVRGDGRAQPRVRARRAPLRCQARLRHRQPAAEQQPSRSTSSRSAPPRFVVTARRRPRSTASSGSPSAARNERHVRPAAGAGVPVQPRRGRAPESHDPGRRIRSRPLSPGTRRDRRPPPRRRARCAVSSTAASPRPDAGEGDRAADRLLGPPLVDRRRRTAGSRWPGARSRTSWSRSRGARRGRARGALRPRPVPTAPTGRPPTEQLRLSTVRQPRRRHRACRAPPGLPARCGARRSRRT